MNPSSKSGTTLALATLFAITIVGLTHALTRAPIASTQQQWVLEQLAAVLPQGEFDNNPADSVRYRTDTLAGGTEKLAIYTAIKNNQPIAFALEVVAPNGYNGNIRLLLGIDVDGTIIGARVVEHRETPGLGDDIDHRKSDWMQSFNEQSILLSTPSHWNVKQAGGQYNAFTGATITPRAVITAIHQALIWYKRNRAWMNKP